MNSGLGIIVICPDPCPKIKDFLCEMPKVSTNFSNKRVRMTCLGGHFCESKVLTRWGWGVMGPVMDRLEIQKKFP